MFAINSKSLGNKLNANKCLEYANYVTSHLLINIWTFFGWIKQTSVSLVKF